MPCAATVRMRGAHRALPVNLVVFPAIPVIVILIFLTSKPALAEFSLILTGTTNYLYRGFSKSDNNPVAQINIDYQHDSGIFQGVFLGTWVSMIDFGDTQFDDPARVEISPYLGWTKQLHSDWRFETFYTRYVYAGKLFGKSADYHEFYWSVHFRDLFSTTVAWSPNIYGQRQTAFALEGTARYPLAETLEFSAGLGYSRLRDALEYDYLYWNGGISWYLHRHITLDLRYAQSAHAKSKHIRSPWPYDPDPVGPTAVFTISVGF